MFKLFKRSWAYTVAFLTGKFDEMADPKVQLQQSIQAAQDQQRRLKEQAANVIANQKTTELRLTRSMDELTKVNAKASQALMMADEQRKIGNPDKAADFDRAAEAFANRLVTLEHEITDLKELHLQATHASQQAKEAVDSNAQMLQRRLAEQQKLMSQLDQAKMAEQLNEAMGVLTDSVGHEIPSLDQVRQKIEARYAKAKGIAEISSHSVENHMLEIETAQMDAQAQQRLSELRTKLGITAESESSNEQQQAQT